MKKLLTLSHFTLFLALFVILWGAWLRFLGFGDACGEHWPLCHGSYFPTSIPAFVEWFHRLSSAVFGVFVLVINIMSFKFLPAKHKGRLFAFLTLLFTLTEAAIGAKLVLSSLVADNLSLQRAVILPLHLINSFLLLGTLKLLIFSLEGQILKIKNLTIFIILILLGITGSLASLSSLVSSSFFTGSFLSELLKDFDSDSPILIRLRILHPLVAVVFFLVLIWIKKRSLLLFQISLLAVFQLIVGGFMIFLGPFIVFRLLHVLGAYSLWLLSFHFLIKYPDTLKR